jgi:hypothetical protein
MKKGILPLTLWLCCSGLLWSQAQTKIRLLPDEEKYITVGLLSGFYFPRDAVFKEIYGQSAPFFGAELTLRFPIQDPHGLDIGAGGRLLNRKGVTSYTQEALSLRLSLLFLSVRYSYDTGRFGLFFGPGIEYIMYREKYAEPFPRKSTSGSKTGVHLTAGGYYHLSSALSLKGYVKYIKADTSAPGFRVRLGGTECGLGVLYRFYF